MAEVSVNLFRSGGDRFGLAMSLARLGVTAIGQLDYPAGQEALEESTRICRQIGDSLARAIVLRHRGIGQLRRGELAPAAASLSEALVVLRDQRDRLLTVQCLETLAAVLAGSGEHLRRRGSSARCRRSVRRSACRWSTPRTTTGRWRPPGPAWARGPSAPHGQRAGH